MDIPPTHTLTFHYPLSTQSNKKFSSNFTTVSKFYLRTVDDSEPNFLHPKKNFGALVPLEKSKPNIKLCKLVSQQAEQALKRNNPFKVDETSLTNLSTSQIISKGKTHDVSYIMDQFNKLAKNEELLKIPSAYAPKGPKLEPVLPRSNSELQKYKKELADASDFVLKKDIFKEIPSEFYSGNLIQSPKRLPEINDEISDPILKLRNKRLPDLGIPSSRSDAIALLKWLDQSLIMLQERQNTNEKFELAQTIYYACFKEMVRQVAVQCSERGVALQKLWNAYIALIKGLNIHYNNSMLENKRKLEYEIIQAKSNVSKELNKMKEELFSYKQFVEKSKQDLNNAKEELEIAKNEHLADKKCWEIEQNKLTAKISELGLEAYKNEQLNSEIYLLEKKMGKLKNECETFKNMLINEKDLNAMNIKIKGKKFDTDENLILLNNAEIQVKSDTQENSTQCVHKLTFDKEIQTPNCIILHKYARKIQKYEKNKEFEGLEENFKFEKLTNLEIRPLKPKQKMHEFQQTCYDYMRDVICGNDPEMIIFSQINNAAKNIEIKMDVNALSEKILENMRLNEENENLKKAIKTFKEEYEKLQKFNNQLKETLENNNIIHSIENVNKTEEKKCENIINDLLLNVGLKEIFKIENSENNIEKDKEKLENNEISKINSNEKLIIREPSPLKELGKNETEESKNSPRNNKE